MAFPAKIDFRSTDTYGGGDDAGETHVYGPGGFAEAYAAPLRDGFNMGWTTNQAGVGVRDRNTTPPAKFAGIHFNESANQCTFKIELDATGTHTIRAIFGDYDGGQTIVFSFWDDTTQIGSTVTTSTAAGDRFIDAAGLGPWSSAGAGVGSWDANNTAVTHTFTTNILNVKIGNNAATGTGFITYLEVSAVIAAATPTKPMWPMSFF